MSETQIKHTPATTIVIREEGHPHFVDRVCWRAYEVGTNRRVGWTDISREYLLSQLKHHKVVSQ